MYAVGDRRVLKLYPTVSAPDSVTEARVLDYLNGRLPVATPELLAHGEYENGWRYGATSQLPGTDRPRPGPPSRDRTRTGLPARPARCSPRCTAWTPNHCARSSARPTGPAFLAGQRATAVERQREVNLPEAWLSQIEGFLESVPTAPGRERVLLHTEVIREHLVVNPGTWTLSGLLDFECAMSGNRAYEFVAACLFVSRGDPRLLGRILAAYGRSFDPRELLAYTLLHVHSNLPECLSVAPGPARAHPGFPGPDLVRYRLDLPWEGHEVGFGPAGLRLGAGQGGRAVETGEQPLVQQSAVVISESGEIVFAALGCVVADQFHPGPADGCVVFLWCAGVAGGGPNAVADHA